MPTARYVQTVLGPVAPADLGPTLTHEHLLVRLGQPDSPATDPIDRARWEEQIRLENLHEVRMHYTMYRDNLSLDSEPLAIEELAHFKRAGGGTIVDVTSGGLGRNPEALRRISSATGVQVVMGAGYYVWQFHPDEIAELSEQDICDLIVRDVQEGEDGVKPGIIGEVGLTWPVHPAERKVLRAAARAQARTGVALSIHPGRNPAAPMDAIKTVIAAGGDPSRTVIDHLDRTLFDIAAFLELAETGCWLELDLFGLESVYAPSLDVDLPNDAMRVRLLRQLADAGYLDRVLVAHDICLKHQLRTYGGPGYDHILSNVVPLMRRRGWTEAEINQVLVENPAEMLAIG